MRPNLPSFMLTAFLLISLFAAFASATPFTDAVQQNDPARLDSLLAGEDAAKQMNRKDESGFTPIHYAVELNFRTPLSSLIRAGVDLEVEDPWGRTPLMLAATRGDAEVTGYLLRRGAVAGAADDAGMKALHYAVISGSDAVVDTVLSREINIDAVTDRDQSPLTIAIIHEQNDLASHLLELGANPNLRDDQGMGPLHHAVVTGNSELVSTLLNQFADVNLLTETGMTDKSLEEATALHLAIAYNHPEMIEQLVSAGASTRVANKRAETPLMLAINQAPGTVVSRLLAAGASMQNPGGDRTPLSLAIKRGDVALVSTLLDYGARLDQSLPSGDMPLLSAVRLSDTEMVKMLLSRGAQSDTTASRDYPLEVALQDGHFGLATQLLDAGANPNRIYAPHSASAFSRSTPRTPLSIAVNANSLRQTRLLLDHGADVNVQVADWSQSLLEQAVSGAELPIVRLLIAEGSRVTEQSSMNADAIGLAIKRGYPYLREVLMATGFNPAAADRNGNSYLHLAMDRPDDARLVIVLVASGVDVSQVNVDGRTALHDAARRGKADMVLALLNTGADPTMLDNQSKTALDIARGGAKTVLLTY